MRQEPAPQQSPVLAQDLERQQRLERSIIEAHRASAAAHEAIKRAVVELGLTTVAPSLSRKEADE